MWRRWMMPAAVGLALLACGAPTGDPVGFRGPDRPVKKVILRPGEVAWRDTFYDAFVPTGRHYRLAVGGYGAPGTRFRSRALLRFELGDVPKEIGGAKITAAYLILPYLRVSGRLNDEYAQEEATLQVHALRRDFDEDRATWRQAQRKENWTTPGGDFGPVVASAVVGKPSYQREFLQFDLTDLVIEWLSNPYRNYGLLLKTAEEDTVGSIKEFFSTNEVYKGNAIRLRITYEGEEGEKAYYAEIPEKDCFITDYEGIVEGTSVHGYDEWVDFGSFNGYGRRALFYFDLSPERTGIPETASIARARLRLFYRPAGRNERVNVAVFRLTAPFEEGMTQDTLELQKFHDNIAYVDREFKTESPGYVDLHLNPLVQEWISGKYPNYGLMIKAPDESEAQVFPVFGSQNNVLADRQPYLEIEYTVPEQPWYLGPAGPE